MSAGPGFFFQPVLQEYHRDLVIFPYLVFLQHAQLLLGEVVVSSMIFAHLEEFVLQPVAFIFWPFKQLSTIFLPSVQDIYLLFQNNSTFVLLYTLAVMAWCRHFSQNITWNIFFYLPIVSNSPIFWHWFSSQIALSFLSFL